jgi:hypothetical protein
MRQFYWDKIPDIKREKTIWKDIDDGGADLELEALLDTFQAAEVKQAAKPEADAKPKVVEIVNPTKSKTVFIVLRSLKASEAAIANELLSMKSSISIDHLASLRTCLPDQSDFDAINAYEGPRELLGACERFYLALIHVSMLQLRVDLLLRSAEAGPELKEAIDQAAQFSTAVAAVNNSGALKEVLALILKVGNFLNGGSARGGAYGFKIDFLTKLKDVRSADPSFTLLHFIAMIVEKEMPKLMAIVTDLEPVIAASKLDIDHARETVAKYRSIIGLCKSKQPEMSLLMTDDGLPKFADKYIAQTQPLCQQFDGKMQDAVTVFEEMRASYGEDAMKPDEFFGVFAKFIADFQTAIKENHERDKKAGD